MNLYPLTFAFVLVACDPDKDARTDTAEATADTTDADTEDTGAVDDPEPEAEIDLDIDEVRLSLTMPNPQVYDPKLAGSEPLVLGWTVVNPDDDCTVSARIANGIGQLRTLDVADSSALWDGRTDEGIAFDTGPATVSLMAECNDGSSAVEADSIWIVRLGLSAIDLHSARDSDGNVALAFHKQSLFETGVSAVGTRPEYRQSAAGSLGSSLDQDSGEARYPVPLWADPDIPPWADGEADQHNVPAGFIGSSAMAATVQFGAVAVSQQRSVAIGAWGPQPDDVPPVRVAVNGVVIDAPVGPGATATVDIGTSPDTMGRHVPTLEWQWQAQTPDGEWHPISGGVETHHVIYTLAGEPALLDGTAEGKAPPIPWIGVLENTAPIMEGVPASTTPVLTALRNHLFEHDYIIYDPGSGTYTDFEGPYMYWDTITAQLSPFLDRGAGLSLYCHSMSCMLSALAGNHGVRAEQLVLGVYFDTNHTRAAGTEDWRRWSFNSHSVVSPDDGATIWDSSIALDGDDDPYNEPIEEVMPAAMDGEEYMWRLTYDEIEIINQGLCYIE